MDKPFKTFRQQIRILRKRNLLIPKGNKTTEAIKILKNEGYYNVINGYKEVFLDIALTKQSNEDVYKEGTTFEHIYALYNFDRNISSIIFKYILKMETSLKTKISYFFSQAYKKDRNYLDKSNFSNPDSKEVCKLVEFLEGIIKRNQPDELLENQKENQIYHYLKNHKELPLWVLATKMTLGKTIHFYSVMKMEDKLHVIREIARSYQKEYGTKIDIPETEQEAYISNMLAFINDVRNICAHETRLYSISVKNHGRKPRIKLFHKNNAAEFKSTFIDCIIILGFFLEKKDYEQMISYLGEEIALLSSKLPQKIFMAVLFKMAFSSDWKTKIKLP